MARIETLERAHCKLCGHVWTPRPDDQPDSCGHVRCPACHDGEVASWSHPGKSQRWEDTAPLAELQQRARLLQAEIVMRQTELLMVRHRIDQAKSRGER